MSIISRVTEDNGNVTLSLSGKIDATNAPACEKELYALLADHTGVPVVLDCDQVEYFSSAGLRVFLRLKQKTGGISFINVHPELYNILEMTGFTEMVEVRKAFMEVSVDGCEVVGEGANGKVYRIDPEEQTAFIGFPPEIAFKLWRRSLEIYLGTTDERRVDEVEAKAAVLGLARMIWREIKHNTQDTEDGKKRFAVCRAGLDALLPVVDTLAF